jgi:outer membrane usher protein PapC
MMFKHSKLRQTILLALSMGIGNSYAAEFNTDVLDAEDMNNIDMSQFSVAGYVPPGDYVLTVFVNGQRLGEPRDIAVFDDKSAASQQVCLAPPLLEFMGLKKSAEEKVL